MKTLALFILVGITTLATACETKTSPLDGDATAKSGQIDKSLGGNASASTGQYDRSLGGGAKAGSR